VGVRNVVPIIDNGETKDSWALVMPRADMSLREELRRVRCMPSMKTILAILTDVAEALTDLDGKIVHRDLKPENILLLSKHWCLADFGISRYAEATTALDTRKFAFSPPYAAPERWRNERATIAADVYALGVIAYEMLQGALPFCGPSLEQFREQHLHAVPKKLDHAPASLAALAEECLYKSAEARPRPATILDRIAAMDRPKRFVGIERLQEANRTEAARRSEAERSASVARSDSEKRTQLAKDAAHGLLQVTNTLKDAIATAAPTCKLEVLRSGAWSIALNGAQLRFSGIAETAQSPWGSWEPPAFRVIAHASLAVRTPLTRLEYEGRSHSLWYCDAKVADQYQWFETAFMLSPLVQRRSSLDPFALEPCESSAKALWRGLAEFQIAWPFAAIEMSNSDELIDRWATWFATATEGRLCRPSTMPERSAEGSWRRGH
jgi:serine/threonine-protein kinase